MAFSLSKSARWLTAAGPVEHRDGVRETDGVRLVVAAAATLLRRQARGEVRDDVVDEALLHALLSVDAPRADRVHLRLKVRGEVRPFRDVVTVLARWPRQHIGRAIVGVETGTRFFDVDVKEAYAKVVSIYTINWSNFMPYAPTVRARFFTDPPEHQQGFLRAFLELYDDGTDVTGLDGADKAAAWLRAKRRCMGEQTLVLRDDVDTIVDAIVDTTAVDVIEGRGTTDRVADAVALESELRDALAAFADVVADTQRALLADFKTTTRYREYAFELDKLPPAHWPTDMQWLVQCTNEVLTASPPHHAALAELLAILQVPPGQIACSTFASACASLAEASLPWQPQPITQAALPALTSSQERLRRAARAVLERGC
ncbi:MAG TPA: hypothetical protein VGF99_04055 [Myxococcota bacterium]